ncbi:hypothetical protein ACOMHN_053576 [Nucella lapillus]
MELKSLSHTHPQLLVDALTTLGLLRCYGLEVGSPKVGTAGSGGLKLSDSVTFYASFHNYIPASTRPERYRHLQCWSSGNMSDTPNR